MDASARSPLTDWLTTTPPPPSWLIPDILAAGRMIILGGSPGAGKSFLSYNLALAGAIGAPFLGSTPASPFKTLIFDEENSPEDAAEYLRWAWNGLQRPDPDLIASRLWSFNLALSRQATAAARQDFMRRVAAEFQPDLTIIDTATPVCMINDENDNAEASRAISNLRKLRAIAGPKSTMLILKHMRVDKEDGSVDIRGAKAWKGEVDNVLFLAKKAGRPITILGRHFSPTKLWPDKVRAFGLSRALKITPGLATSGVRLIAEPADRPFSAQPSSSE